VLKLVSTTAGQDQLLREVFAAINLSGPEALMDSPESQARYLDALIQSAARISAELGA
jgi:DNA-binding IclR family transcriptional regulator